MKLSAMLASEKPAEKERKKNKKKGRAFQGFRSSPKERMYGQLPLRIQEQIPNVDLSKIYVFPKGNRSGKKIAQESICLGEVVDILDRSSGRLFTASRMLGMRYGQLLQLINARNPQGAFLREVLEMIEGELLDEIELHLIRSAKNLEDWAIKFFLTNKGKSRGYGGESKVAPTTIVIGGDIPTQEYE